MRRLFFLLSLIIIGAPSAGANMEDAKVALHVQARTSKGVCESAPTLPCYRYVTRGDIGVSYDIYLVVANVHELGGGVRGLSCGIAYDAAPGQGVDVYSWSFCGDGLEFPHEGVNGPWPAAGSGTRLTWVDCDDTYIPPNGVHAMAGSFYVYAYGSDMFQVTQNTHLDTGPELKVADCLAAETDLPLSAAGIVAFSPGAADSGHNPCGRETIHMDCQVVPGTANFGLVGLGGYKDLSVPLTNPGYLEGEPVEGTATLDCPGPGFSIVGGASYYLPNPGDRATIVVRFTPATIGEQGCTLRLGSGCNDVALTATAIHSPDPVVSPPDLNQTLFRGYSNDQSLEISNAGTAVLDWSIFAEQGTLEDALAALDAGNTSVINKIPNRVNFSGGVTGRSIGAFNYLKTDLGGPFDYSDGIIRESIWLGPGGRYFTRKYPGLFVFAADLAQIGKFTSSGQLSSGLFYNFMERVIGLKHGYAASILRVWGTGTPSIHRILICSDNSNPINYYNQFRNEILTYNLPGTTRFYYLLYMGANGVDIPTDAAMEIVNAFLDVVAPDPQWLTVTPGPQLFPGERGTTPVHFSADGLGAGGYSGHVTIGANSVNHASVIIPVTLTVTEPPDIDVPENPISFASTFVGDQGRETLSVGNVGLSPLNLRAEITNGPFTVTPESLQVSAQSAALLLITFAPTAAGSFTGTIRLTSNDPDESMVNVALSGEAVPPPELSMASSPLFAVAPPGGVNFKPFLIGNTGANPLIFSTQGSESWVCSEPITGTVMPGQSLALKVKFDAANLLSGERQADLRFLTNDPQHRVATLPVMLRVASVEVRHIDVDPNTLNPGAHGHWVKATVELPDGDVPENIVLETVVAQHVVPVDPDGFSIGDVDQNGVTDVTLRFDRAAFLRSLPPEDNVEALILGEIRDTHYFWGRDEVRVLRPHLLSPNGGERLSAGTFRDVSWESEDLDGVDSMSLFYSPDGGQSWQPAGVVSGATHLAWRVPADATANARLKVEAYGSGEFIGYDITDTPFSVTTETTGITPTPELRTVLYQNAPNPFHATTTIAYSLAAAGDVSMDVFDISGKQVRALVRGIQGNGPQVATWDGRDDAGRRVTPGMYVVRLRTGAVQASRRLLLMP